jgi:hypothetical protein
MSDYQPNTDEEMESLQNAVYYTPDNWVVLEIKPEGKETIHKVLTGVSGGYLDGDSWRMNSGIESVEEDGDYYMVHGFSGSTYRCHKGAETMRMNCSHIYERIKEARGDNVKIIDMKDYLNESR